jgi:hypothetical protein
MMEGRVIRVVVIILCLFWVTLVIGIVLLLRCHVKCLVRCFSHTMVLLLPGHHLSFTTYSKLHSICPYHVFGLRYKIIRSMLLSLIELLAESTRAVLITLALFNLSLLYLLLISHVRIIPVWRWCLPIGLIPKPI